MYTSVLLMACAGFSANTAPAATVSPVWTENYFTAMEKGQKEKKPLAVFVASGTGNFEKALQDGIIGEETRKVLHQQYLCVYLDQDDPVQKKLVQKFGIHSGHGIILSDRAGELQAFHHDGTLAGAELLRQLVHFADPSVEVKTTIYTRPQQRVSYYPQQNVQSFFQGSYAPAAVSRPVQNC